ncbi:uncharacterized protein MYCFIDRAFT_87829 [Pseudocercospora fijiensis CIRAD86]|uniref:DNA polymerase delta subunit 3 n=1 Tax=Pseudocercospora fijiensis (strain CIRAD86) TaxID=383855 RepID=M2YL53_PSEFD|nr:uncharacterized protein MYCFIDRAFT_87829 [Pseudocercospora fijiensis CIRAD86]EME78465.1 hypothetical protein MYCFIDRAFT_87829 [Pseudocercospora fijiensis CIRAD86]
MSQDYNEYLAVNVLNEQHYVTYRNLSRALKVHSNTAKQMLYEFHRKQHSKKPGSVHATYLVAGTKRSHTASSTDTNADGKHDQDENDQDGDVPMNSSPPMPSSSLHQPHAEHNSSASNREVEVALIRSVMLVREQQLEKARAQFETITGIHIYSLQPNGLSDFQLLTDCNRRLLSDYANEDPLTEWKQYGVIQNANVKRRTRKNAPPIPPPAATAKKPEPTKAKPVTVPQQPAREDSQDSKTPVTSATAKTATSSTTKKGATSKKEGGLRKAFARGAAKLSKSESQQSATVPSPPAEDAPMTGFSDDDDDDVDATLAEPEETRGPSGASRKDRKAALEAMMDREDESMDDAPEPADEPAPEDKSRHDDGALDKNAARDEESKETVTVENGRRRGRRRIMKKKTVKDEEGYLVTKEEPVWEEFSEEEPAPKKAKVSASAPSSKAGEKKTAKKGQGNITSFFGKR